MTDCKAFLQQLGDCLDDLAAVPVRKDFEAHLQRCPKCHVIWDTTRQTLYLYKHNCGCHVPPDVEARLMSALTALFGHRGWQGGWKPS